MSLNPFPGGGPGRDHDDDVDPTVSFLAVEQALARADRAARMRRDAAGLGEAGRPDARYRAQVAAAVGVAASAAGRAAVWVAELAARTGGPRLAEYAAAVLACGRDLAPEDFEDGGVPEDVAFVLSGLVLVGDPGLTADEGLALAAVGAIALAMPRTITVEHDPVGQLPELARHLDRAVAAGRRGGRG